MSTSDRRRGLIRRPLPRVASGLPLRSRALFVRCLLLRYPGVRLIMLCEVLASLQMPSDPEERFRQCNFALLDGQKDRVNLHSALIAIPS